MEKSLAEELTEACLAQRIPLYCFEKLPCTTSAHSGNLTDIDPFLNGSPTEYYSDTSMQNSTTSICSCGEETQDKNVEPVVKTPEYVPFSLPKIIPNETKGDSPVKSKQNSSEDCEYLDDEPKYKKTDDPSLIKKTERPTSIDIPKRGLLKNVNKEEFRENVHSYTAETITQRPCLKITSCKLNFSVVS